MKYGIAFGHNTAYNKGASGCGYLEDDLTRDLGERVISKLQSLGEDVVNCTPTTATSLNDSLQRRCNIAKDNGVDLFVEIHFNSAFGGLAYGTETFCNIQNPVGRQYANNVHKELVALGFANRGVKDGFTSYPLFVIKKTVMTGLVLEICFINNQNDMNKYDAEKVANAIVKGLTGKDVEQPKESKFYVQTQNFTGEFVEIMNIYRKYFSMCDRFYTTAVDSKTVNFSTQYLPKDVCESIIIALNNDNLSATIVEDRM